MCQCMIGLQTDRLPILPDGTWQITRITQSNAKTVVASTESGFKRIASRKAAMASCRRPD